MPKTRLKKSSSKSIQSYFSAHFFLIVGLLLISFSIYWSFYEQTVLSFNDFKPPQVNLVLAQNTPVKLIIPKRLINLPIQEASISNGNWQINPDGASHLQSSADPGEAGNIIIYGHNKKNLLGGIVNLKPGDGIIIVDEKGREHHYKISRALTVNPSDVWVLDNTSQETLTLYTCTGLFDLKRFVIKAEPVI